VGPGVTNLDYSLIKNVPVKSISDAFNIQFRAEFFNLFNRANFQSPIPNNTLFNTNGSAVATAGQISQTAADSRQIQFGLKVVF
jgi:hypothetical protein